MVLAQAGTGEFAVKEKRPYLSSLCETLSEAEKWRRQIMTEISKGVCAPPRSVHRAARRRCPHLHTRSSPRSVLTHGGAADL